jgi:hypothetical protein
VEARLFFGDDPERDGDRCVEKIDLETKSDDIDIMVVSGRMTSYNPLRKV